MLTSSIIINFYKENKPMLVCFNKTIKIPLTVIELHKSTDSSIGEYGKNE